MRTVKTALQILVGVLMWVVSVIVCYDLGFIMNRPGPPNRDTGFAILALFLVTQLLAALIYLRHIAPQVLWGLGLSGAFVIAWLYLGPFWEQLSPDGNSYATTWRTDLAFALLVVATQWFSFWAFRQRIALQVSAGIALFAFFAIPLLYSELMFSWEKHSPDGSIIIGWRTDVLSFLLVAATQGISLLAFRRIRRDGRKLPAGTVASQLHS
jgi:hypothetical protein